MSEANSWARAFVRQADADFRAWEFSVEHPEAVAAECHRLLFLQMACEKLCKAYLIRGGTPIQALQGSHGYVANPLPGILKAQFEFMGSSLRGKQALVRDLRHLALEIELRNPAVRREGRRPDNCEYPWEIGGVVVSPLDWSFSPLQLSRVRSGRIFMKLLRGAIDRLLQDLSTEDPQS